MIRNSSGYGAISDLREIQLIRYEYLMADYREENQARLEKVMAEMVGLCPGNRESGQELVCQNLGLKT